MLARDKPNIHKHRHYQARKEYYSAKIVECGRDQKSVHKIARHLLGEEETGSFPNQGTPEELTTKFSDFFKEKICSIRHKLDSTSTPVADSLSHQVHIVQQELHVFEPASEDEIRNHREQLEKFKPKLPAYVTTPEPCAFSEDPGRWITWMEGEVTREK